jgi:hypothetical protein
MHYFFIKALIFSCIIIIPSEIFSQSGVQTPTVSIDGNPETEGISPPPQSVITGETFIIAVTARNVENLHSYSFKCQFDSRIVNFNNAVSKLSPLSTAFLETRNGSIAAFLALPSGGNAEIAATLSGNDSTKCVSGDGILGFLSFTAKVNGNPDITITDAQLVTPDGKRFRAEITK